MIRPWSLGASGAARGKDGRARRLYEIPDLRKPHGSRTLPPMPRPLPLLLTLLALSTLACLGPRPAFPDDSTCGSTLAPGAALAAPLTVTSAGRLGTSCYVANDGSLHCAWEKTLPEGPLAHVSVDSSTMCAIYEEGNLWCS